MFQQCRNNDTQYNTSELSNINPLFAEVKQLIEQSKNNIAVSLKAEISLLYWNIGNRINEELQKQSRSESYGKQIVAALWRQSSNEYGASFSEKNYTNPLSNPETDYQISKAVAKKTAKPIKKTVHLLLLGLFLSCSPSPQKEEIKGLEPLPLSYAKGFKISQGDGYKVIEVTQAFSGKHDPFRYLVVEKENSEFEEAAYDAVISPPVKSIILTSTTQVPHLDLLGISDQMIGFPDTDLISSEIMRKQIEQGKVTDLGTGAKANLEMMIDLDPDMIVISTLGDNLQQLSLLKNAGIPAIINGEYTEQDPLGRAEWIKFTGALTGKYTESVKIFEEIEAAYLSLKEKISHDSLSQKPSVISGVMYKDIWYAPAGESWGTLFLKDAGCDYIFKDESGTGSLQLNYEYVLDQALEADFWIGAADFNDLEAMGESDPRYTNFKAFKNGQVYTFTKKRGATGGIEYFELGYMRPDIILKDLVKIFHPEALPEYEPYFYEKLN